MREREEGGLGEIGGRLGSSRVSSRFSRPKDERV